MALLVVLGAMSDGRKQVLAVRPGHRESTESWLSVLRDLRDRGLRAPVLMMADGALPIWSAVDQVWPETSQQRCWNHKIINVLDNLPKRGQGKARVLLTQIPTATTRAQAEARRDTFAARYRDRYPKAVATLERDWERMVTFYDFPQQHWRHLRTTNPVESPFASVRLRTNAGKRHKRVQTDGRRKTLSKAQCLRAIARRLCRTEVPGWKAYPRREDRKAKDEKGRLISFTHLSTQPLEGRSQRVLLP